MAEPKGNVYADRARLKKVAEDALDELRANEGFIDDLKSRVAQRDDVITMLRKDNKNMQKALAEMATDNPKLYVKVARKYNLM